MKLGEASEVRSGLVLSRKQAKEISQYRYKLLNLKSINAEGYINTETLDIFDSVEKLNPEYLTHNQDVVVRLSAPYTAVLIDKSTEEMVISSNFLVIRTDENKVLPEYLYWLLNTDKIKKDILKNNTSNMLGAIRPQYYSNLEIVQLSIEQQSKLSSLFLLSKKEEALLIELKEQKAIYHKLLLNKIQKQMRKGKQI